MNRPKTPPRPAAGHELQNQPFAPPPAGSPKPNRFDPPPLWGRYRSCRSGGYGRVLSAIAALGFERFSYRQKRNPLIGYPARVLARFDRYRQRGLYSWRNCVFSAFTGLAFRSEQPGDTWLIRLGRWIIGQK